MAEKTFVEMTVVEKFGAVAEMIEDAEVRAWLLDRQEKAGRKASTPRKPKPEVAERKAVVATFLADQDAPVLAKEVAEATDMTPGQASAALRALVADGIAVAIDPEKGKGAKTYVIA